jgi:hypothetical protein
MKTHINKFFKNESFRFVFLKYLSFGILFINVFILNSSLGLYYFGIYSFYKLILSYSSYTNLGINYALNILPANKKIVSRKHINDLFVNSVVYNFITSFFSIIIFFYALNNFSYFEKFEVKGYFYYLAFIYVIRQINILYVSYNRLLDNIKLLNLNYLLPVVIEFLFLCFTKTENWSLFINILYVYGLSQLILLLVNVFYLVKSNFKVSRIYFDSFFVKKSIQQLIYNLSFYGIWLSIKTIFSKYFTLQNYSEFSFISSVVEALFLSTGAITFLMLPKLLNKISNLKEHKSLINLNQVYNSSNSMLCVLSILSIPILNIFFPEYSNVQEYFCTLLLAHFFLNSPFTFNTLLINKGEENILTIIGILVILIIIVIISILVNSNINLNLRYLLVIIIFSSFVYSTLVKVIAVKKYNLTKLNLIFFFNEIIMLKETFVIFVALLFSFINIFYLYLIPVFIAIHLILNFKSVFIIASYIKKLLNNPDILTLNIKK